MYLLDSDWLIDVFGGRPGPAQALGDLRRRDIGISIISRGELYEGAFDYPDASSRLARIRAFLDEFETLPLTDPIMEIFGRTRSELRRQGQLIPDLDLLIAATALYHDLILLTRNRRHFSRIAQLRVYPES
jgi:tRNA(fMet)-specific endonuclease VapC